MCRFKLYLDSRKKYSSSLNFWNIIQSKCFKKYQFEYAKKFNLRNNLFFLLI